MMHGQKNIKLGYYMSREPNTYDTCKSTDPNKKRKETYITHTILFSLQSFSVLTTNLQVTYLIKLMYSSLTFH